MNNVLEHQTVAWIKWKNNEEAREEWCQSYEIKTQITKLGDILH